MVRKFLLAFLFNLIVVTTGAAHLLDPYEDSDICLSAARNQEASDDLIPFSININARQLTKETRY